MDIYTCLLYTSSREVKKIIKEFKPAVVVGFGGYVSGPVVRTACKLGVKTAIHEQNASYMNEGRALRNGVCSPSFLLFLIKQ